MEFVIVRHGESESNKRNEKKEVNFGGRYPSLLTEKGRNQAISLRPNQWIQKIEKIYSSNLARALETAKLANPGVTIEIEENLQERSLGKFDGMLIEEVRKHYPKYMEEEPFKRFRHDFEIKAPAGENYTDLCNRCEEFFSKIDVKENTVVGIFSHICLIRCFLYLLLGISKEEVFRLTIPNCDPIVVKGTKIGNFKLISHKVEELMVPDIRK